MVNTQTTINPNKLELFCVECIPIFFITIPEIFSRTNTGSTVNMEATSSKTTENSSSNTTSIMNRKAVGFHEKTKDASMKTRSTH
jgi:hypothetical protein